MTTNPLERFGAAALALLLSIGAGVWLAPYGLALSPDGAHYMNVALRIAYDGFSLVDPKYPVGYPLLVGLVMPFERFPMDAAFWISLSSFGATLGGVGALARRVSPSSAFTLAAVLGCALFIPIWSAHLFALSEAPFTALLVLHVVCVAKHLEAGRADSRAALGWFALASLCAGASAVVRVMGYALVLAFSAYAFAWMLRGSRDAAARAKLVAAHALSYLPAAGVGVANVLAGRAVHGDRPSGEAAESFANNAIHAVSTLSGDLGVALISTLFASVFALFVHLHRVPNMQKESGASIPSDVALGGASVYLYVLALVSVYVPVLLVGASLVKISPIGTRFLMPIYPLAFVLVLGVARFAPRPLRGIAAVLPLLSIAQAAVLGVGELGRRNAEFAATATQTDAIHLAVGFDASPSARGLGEFLREVSRSEAPSLSSIFPMPRGGQHARLARAVLFRESSAASASFRLVAADELVLEFETKATAGEGGARLSYFDLPITGQDSIELQSLLGSLFALMRERERAVLWLLTPVGGDPLRGTGELVGGPLLLRERRELGAYNAYRFEMRSPENAALR